MRSQKSGPVLRARPDDARQAASVRALGRASCSRTAAHCSKSAAWDLLPRAALTGAASSRCSSAVRSYDSRMYLCLGIAWFIGMDPCGSIAPGTMQAMRLILEDEGHTGTARPPLGVSHDFQEVLSSVAVALRGGVDELLYESSPLCHSFATTLHRFLHFTIAIFVQILPNVRPLFRPSAGIT